MSKIPTDELISKILGRGIPIIALLALYYTGFFVQDSSIYNELHPFKIWDAVGLGLITAVVGYTSGIVQKIFPKTVSSNTLQVGLLGLIAAAIGVALIFA